METKSIHIEMECIHDHVNQTMTCSWLNGEIKIVVDWKAAQLGVMNGSKVVEVRDVHGMTVEEFMHLQEQCQAAAAGLALFNAVAV